MKKIQPTKQDVHREILRCGKDCTYFIDNYIKISHPLKGVIPFKLYEYQKNVLEDYGDYRFNIILKARQLGISTLTSAYIAWLMIFHRGKNVMVIATKFKVACNLVKKVKFMIKNTPSWLRIADIRIDNEASFELDNDSWIKASSTSNDAGRSEALSLLVIDEAAHVKDMEDVWTATYSTIATGGRCIALSSPNGVDNWFYKTYVSAEAQENDFNPIKLLWNVHPDRDQEWFDKESRNMSQKQINQELLCSFNMSGDSFIQVEDLQRIEQMCIEPKFKIGFDRNIWVWKEYEAGKTYILSGDVARGDGKDFSTFHVFCVDTMEIVAEYQGKVAPDMFSEIVYEIGVRYNKCLIVIENNSIGMYVLDKLIDKKYPNIYYTSKNDSNFLDEYERLVETDSAVPGFTTSLKSRPMIMAKFEEFVRNKVIKIYSKRLLAEMRTFVWRGARPEAARGKNDDLVMACAIGCWVKDFVYIGASRVLDYKKASINSIYCIKKTIDTKIHGMSGYSEKKQNNFSNLLMPIWKG